MYQIFITILSAIVTLIVIPLITICGKRLISYINTKVKNDNSAKMLSRATTIVTDSVKAVMQTYVDELKKNMAFDKEAQLSAFGKAKDIILSNTTVELKNFITEEFGDFETWLNTQIEVAVSAIKNIGSQAKSAQS